MNPLKDLGVSAAIGAKKFGKAVSAYEQELKNDPNDQHARWMLAHSFMWNDQHKEAIATAQQLPESEQNEFAVLVLFARCYRALAEHQSAYRFACKALENPPDPLPELPRLLRWLPGFRSANRDVEQANWHELSWINQYKKWCEEHSDNSKKGVTHGATDT